MARQSQRLMQELRAVTAGPEFPIGTPQTCDYCKATGVDCDLDRRVPGRLGGEYVIENVHYLCKVCHIEKSAIEGRLLEEVDRWSALAYPSPVPEAAILYNAMCLGGVEEWAATMDRLHACREAAA
jgi:5-methylcytosine-specific restriction endonuclease McrA